MKNVKLFLAVFAVVIGVSFFLGTQKADALVTSTFPRGNDSMIFITEYNSGRLLQTPHTVLRIFYNLDNVPNGATLRVDVGMICRGGNGDPGGHARITGGDRQDWPWQSRCAAKAASGILDNDPAPGNTFTLTLNKSQLQHEAAYGDKYGFAELTLKVDNDNAAIGAIVRATNYNGKVTFAESVDDFGYTSSGAAESYTGHNGPKTHNTPFPLASNRGGANQPTAFALKPKDFAGKTSYSFTFATDCMILDDYPTYLRWYDADKPNLQPDSDFSISLRNNNTGNYVFSNINGAGNLGGNDSYRERKINMQKDHTYTWTWAAVNPSNGIQIWIPFSEFAAQIDCEDGWELGVESQVRIDGGPWLDGGQVHTVRPGQSVEWRHIATRKSGEGLVTFDRERIVEENRSEVRRTGAAKITNSDGNSWVQGPLDRVNITNGHSDGYRICQWYRVWPGNEDNTIPEKNTQGRKACVQVRAGCTTNCNPQGQTYTWVKRDNEPFWKPNVTDIEPGQTAQFVSRMFFHNQTEHPVLGAIKRVTNYFGEYDHTARVIPGGSSWDWRSGINNSPVAGNVAPGTNLCQYAHGDFLANIGTEEEPEWFTAGMDTNLACAQVVGGRSDAAVDGPTIVEQGQTATLNGGIRTNGFHRLDPNYGYNVICRYKVLFQSEELVPETNCNNFIEGNGDIFNSHTYRIPDDAPMGSRYCMIVSIAPGGSTINGPNPNLIGTSEIHKCVEVVGGKTGIAASVSTDTAEPTDYVELYGTSNTSNFHNAGQGYAYNVACSYSVRYMRAGYGGGTSTIQSGPCSYSVASNGAMRVVTTALSIPNSTSYIGNQICMFINIAPAGSNINGPNNNLMGYPTSSASCMEIVARPTVKAYGSDVSAGSGFSVNNASCINSGASVVGWNRWTGSYYKGSGAQMAIFANNQIRGFGSGQNLTRDTAQVPGSAYGPANLSFANSNVALPFADNGGSDGLGAVYGGGFGGGSCIPDYYSGLEALPEDDRLPWVSLDGSNNNAPQDNYSPKAYTAPSATTLGGGVVTTGNNATLYVNGDVYITGNIVGASGTTSVAQIPVFTVIARGNIYIAPNVTQLYGTYIAQPHNGSTGRIYTCANGGVPLPPNRSNYAACGNQLVVTGSFVADKIHLYRNNGSLYQDDGGKVPNSASYTQAAEVFQYNPLNWIRGSLSSVTQSNATFDAITSLPPVL